MRTTSPELDLLLERDLEVLECGPAARRLPRRPWRRPVGQLVGLELEVLAAGDEVGLALQLDDGADLAVDHEADDALGVVAVVALGAGGEALLAQPLLAASMSPSLASRAFFASIIPAPVARAAPGRPWR